MENLVAINLCSQVHCLLIFSTTKALYQSLYRKLEIIKYQLCLKIPLEEIDVKERYKINVDSISQKIFSVHILVY